MSYYMDVFLMKSILGVDVEPEEPKRVIEYCVKKAYTDMMTGGRFYKIKGKDENCKKIQLMLSETTPPYSFSRQLIKDVAKKVFGDKEYYKKKGNKVYVATSFGLAQKIVNMTFKYLYAFRGFTKLDIDFTQCDCPIDSRVLSRMGEDNLLEKDKINTYTWTRLDEGKYTELQEMLDKYSFEDTDELLDCSARLRYDFIRGWL